MNSKLVPSWGSRSGLRWLIAIALVLGIWFRLVNLDRKVYWQDEAATSLRISGYSKIEFVRLVSGSEPISAGDLRQRYLSPNPEKNLGDTVRVLAGKAEHPPLYYLMARLWAQLFGSSVAAMRTLPALISLLAFPAIYWLCLELFASYTVAWIAVALIAVSPLHIFYAQEARQYSLWSVAILLSSAALLSATRQKTLRSWAIYGSTLALGLYSHLFFGLVALGHGIYIIGMEKFRLGQTVRAYMLASLAGLVAFLPWILVFIRYSRNSRYLGSIATALGREISLSSLLGKWFRSVNRIFHDADLGSANLILVILAVYALYFVYRHTPKRAWLFVLTLVGVTALSLGLPDLIWGGQRSVRTRYLIPCALGIELAVAYLLATQMIIALKVGQQKAWQIVTVLFLAIGVLSGAIASQAESGWSKNIAVTKYYPRIARIINEAEAPLVISDGSELNLLSLSYLLEPRVRLHLLETPNLPTLAEAEKDVFLFDASDSLREKLQRDNNLSLELVVDKRRAKLWKGETANTR